LTIAIFGGKPNKFVLSNMNNGDKKDALIKYAKQMLNWRTRLTYGIPGTRTQKLMDHL